MHVQEHDVGSEATPPPRPSEKPPRPPRKTKHKAYPATAQQTERSRATTITFGEQKIGAARRSRQEDFWLDFRHSRWKRWCKLVSAAALAGILTVHALSELIVAEAPKWTLVLACICVEERPVAIRVARGTNIAVVLFTFEALFLA